jgi:hypothetical protein
MVSAFGKANGRKGVKCQGIGIAEPSRAADPTADIVHVSQWQTWIKAPFVPPEGRILILFSCIPAFTFSTFECNCCLSLLVLQALLLLVTSA